MAQRTVFNSWRDANTPNKYPFAESASLTNGTSTIDPSTFVDATLHPVGVTGRLWLTSVVVTFPTVTFNIGNNSTAVIASGSVDPWSASDGRIVLTDAYGRPAGLLLATDEGIGVFQSWSIGVHQFSLDQAEICATCIVPMPQEGVRGFLLDSGDVLNGNVVLVGGSGIMLSAGTTNGISRCGVSPVYETIRVDVVGDALYRRAACGDTELFQTPKFITNVRFLNGSADFSCTPTDNGEILLYAGITDADDSVLRVRTLQDRIVVEAVGSSLGGRASV